MHTPGMGSRDGARLRAWSRCLPRPLPVPDHPAQHVVRDQNAVLELAARKRAGRLSVVVGRNLDNLNLDMCMELLADPARPARRAAGPRWSPGWISTPPARAPRSSATRQTMPRSAFEQRPAEISLSEYVHPTIETAGRQP